MVKKIKKVDYSKLALHRSLAAFNKEYKFSIYLTGMPCSG